MNKIRNKIIILLFVFITFLIIFLGNGLNLLFNNDKIKIDKVEQINSYDQLYDIIKSTASYNLPFWTGQFKDAVNANETSFSQTNIQVAGVDEADVIKTDGEYIYTLSNDKVNIVRASDGNMTIVSTIKLDLNVESYSYFLEMYLNQDFLVIIKVNNNYIGFKEETKIMPDFYPFNNSKTSVIIYNVVDKLNPVKVNELSQSGNYISSRMINNKLYLITNEYLYENYINKDEISSYVPVLDNGTSAKVVEPKDIYVMPNPTSNAFTTISSIDVSSPNEFESSKSILGSSNNIYSSLENIYITSYDSEEENGYIVTKTNILKFNLNNEIKLSTTGSVDGYILNQFSMDEYNGFFRIVTTSNDYKIYTGDNTSSIISTDEQTNNLYVLDKDLKIVSKIEEIAKGERVYSVRFDNEIAYFVTFRNVDPLFVVDLSNPFQPTILSALKIPGFSEYLHVYNDKYLFGLGKEADNNGRVTGLKISMFNTSNKLDLSEDYKSLVTNEWVWSEASYNHKAILVSSDKSLVAFPINNYYVIYNFSEINGFSKLHEIYFNSNLYYGSTRGLYIGNYIYACNQHEIISLNLETLETTNNILLD